MRVQLSILSWYNSLGTSFFFFPDTVWATVVNIQEEYCPFRHCCSLSMEFISFSLFPLINIIFVIHSLVYVFYTVILKLWTVPLCLWDVGPCFFVFVHVVCVCASPPIPQGLVYESGPLCLLLLCQLCAFEQMWVCVYARESVPNARMWTCAWACGLHVHLHSVSLLCVCDSVCSSFLPRPSSSMCLCIVSSVVFSGPGHLAAVENNAE